MPFALSDAVAAGDDARMAEVTALRPLLARRVAAAGREDEADNATARIRWAADALDMAAVLEALQQLTGAESRAARGGPPPA